MSAQAVELVAPDFAAEAPSGERRTMSPCLGLAVAGGLLSWFALGSLLGIALA